MLAATANRRRFLQLVALSAGAGTLGGSAAAHTVAVTSDTGCFPGAPIGLSLGPWAPRGCAVRLHVAHGSAYLAGAAMALEPGGSVALATPYPFDDVVAGAYEVRAQLVDSRGAVLDSLAVGSYSVRKFRFSA